MRILVVDDDSMSRKLLREQLEAEGHVVFEARDGLAGLQVLQSERIDGIISDILMPKMDGYRFCSEVRRNPILAFIPFVFFTGTFVSPENHRFARGVGADGFFEKSAAPNVLVEALQRAAGQVRTPATESLPRAEPHATKEYSDLLIRKLEEKCRDLQTQTEILRQKEEQNHLLAAIVESSEDAIIGKSLDGTILSWNNGAVRLYGYEPREVIGKSISILVPPERQSEIRELIRQAKNGGYNQGLETVRIRKDGSAVDVSTRVSPIRNKEGDVFGISIIARDISREVEMRRKVAASEAELRALAARLETIRENEAIRIAREVHDELGQSLTALNMDLLQLEKKIRAQFPQSQSTAILQQIASILRLVETTTLAVQRISSELRPGILDDLGLTAALEWSAEEFQQRSGIVCQWTDKHDLRGLRQPTATAFFRIFQEVLTNISRHSNATLVKMSLRSDGQEVALEVIDNGKGFPSEKMRDPASLGLLGMRERALLVGGKFEIGPAPGGGTVVRVRASASKQGENN